MSDAHILELLGLIYAVVGAGMLFNPTYARELFEDFYDSPAASFLAGIAALVVGFLLIVSRYDVLCWSNYLLLAIGVLALLKGVFILALPTVYEDLVAKIKLKRFRAIGLTISILGISLFYLGYFLL